MNTTPSVAILHYSASPVVGGVEAVMDAHARLLLAAGYPTTIIAGRGERAALPAGCDFLPIPELDSQHPAILESSAALEQGQVPAAFEALAGQLTEKLRPALTSIDRLIVHNVFTKHFNLPLTAALGSLLDESVIGHCLAWCHDFTWTSPNSRSKVHDGYPWDLLRTWRPDLTYVVVSGQRQQELARLLSRPAEEITIVYNGVDPQELLGLSAGSSALIGRLDLLAADLILLMPVRVTQAKNIELALRVLAALKQRIPRPRLILTGPPDPHDPQSMAYFGQLQALRRELGVETEMRFVFESGPDPQQPYQIDLAAVGDLFRVADLMFMPSHREGFGMPVLEAGLAGLPVVASTAVPAANELGGEDVIRFDPADDPAAIAASIAHWTENSAIQRLRRRVRQRYTWQAIFQHDIEPLLA